jgi:hypothetical protein
MTTPCTPTSSADDVDLSAFADLIGANDIRPAPPTGTSVSDFVGLLDLQDVALDAAAQLGVLAHLPLDEMNGKTDQYGYFLLLRGIAQRLESAAHTDSGDCAEVSR